MCALFHCKRESLDSRSGVGRFPAEVNRTRVVPGALTGVRGRDDRRAIRRRHVDRKAHSRGGRRVEDCPGARISARVHEARLPAIRLSVDEVAHANGRCVRGRNRSTAGGRLARECAGRWDDLDLRCQRSPADRCAEMKIELCRCDPAAWGYDFAVRRRYRERGWGRRGRGSIGTRSSELTVIKQDCATNDRGKNLDASAQLCFPFRRLICQRFRVYTRYGAIDTGR